MGRSLSVWLTVVFVTGCSSGSSGTRTTQADCDKITDSIRDAAAKRGITSAGVCTSTNATIQKDFGDACKALKDCNDQL